jgi:hypothetical protein
VDDLTTIGQAQELQGRAPKIPVTYIAPKRMELPPSFPRKEITAAERRLHRDYLKRFRLDGTFSSTARISWSPRYRSASRTRSSA